MGRQQDRLDACGEAAGGSDRVTLAADDGPPRTALLGQRPLSRGSAAVAGRSEAASASGPARLSACVISYNRAAILETCLRAVGFADEVLVVDKSSTDNSRTVAGDLADRVVRVAWSPTVEETRAFAVSLCHHDWVLLLDDDECLNAAAVDLIRNALADPQGLAYAFPLRHYILGIHDERAYYWPEHHVRLFRRDVVRFGATVHAGMTVLTDQVFQVPADSGACIHHLSHPDVAGWIERTNRYTSGPDRARAADDCPSLVDFAHARIDHWLARSSGAADDDYLAAVSLLRAVYDIVDRLKTWEADQEQDGAQRFQALCRQLDTEHGPSRHLHRQTWRHWLRRAAASLFSLPSRAAPSPPAFRRRPG